MNLEQQLRHSLKQYLGPKTTPKRKLPTGRVEVTSGATYRRSLTDLSDRAQIDPGQLSKFLHGKGSLSLSAASRLAKALRLELK